MGSLISFLIGLVALILAVPALFPLLGWLNWLVLPIALIGAGIGQVSSGTGGRNFCFLVAAFSAFRLSVGHGWI